MHIFTEYVAKYLSLKMLIFGLSWLEHSPSIMSIIFIKKKNATALQQRCCFFPFNTSMAKTKLQIPPHPTVTVTLIAGIFPRASYKVAPGSQSDDSTYLA